MSPETQRLRRDNMIRLMQANVWQPPRDTWWRRLWRALTDERHDHIPGVGGKAMWGYIAVALLIALGDSF